MHARILSDAPNTYCYSILNCVLNPFDGLIPQPIANDCHVSNVSIPASFCGPNPLSGYPKSE